jgi:type IV secretory pathway VirB4 component
MDRSNQLNTPSAGRPQSIYSGEDFTPGSVNIPQAGGPVVAAKAPTNPNSTQNTLQISEIRDGIVIMNDGSFRAVIMCKSINFDLMSPQEREAVEFSYQGFLNSLYFPIQIFIRSQKVDLRPYLERLDKIRSEQDNMLLGLLMEDYIAFLADIAQQTNIMDKKFYLVIKYPDFDQDIRKALKQSTGFFTGLADLFAPKGHVHVVIDENTLETAKTELRNRVQAVMQGLAQAGIQSLPLDTEELIELYYDAYNPDTATRQQLKDFNNMTEPVITKGEGEAPQPNLDRESN